MEKAAKVIESEYLTSISTYLLRLEIWKSVRRWY
jgi:hypothetical protein